MPAGAEGAGQYVFGYGSLAGVLSGGSVAELSGHRRSFGVAMDNLNDAPGYKHYVTPAGERPAVMVAFLDLAEEPSSSVNGVCARVEPEELAVLDGRERSYRRTEVTGWIEDPPGRVWSYLGSLEARRRRTEGPAVVSREYLEQVENGFRRLGESEHRAFLASTELDTLPVWDLIRVDHP